MRLGFALRLICALGLGIVPLLAQATDVEAVRLWSGPESTRVVLDLSAPAEHRVFTLTDPHRIVIDLPAAQLSAPLGLPEGRGAVSAIRTGARPGGDLRVVLDLKAPVQPKSFLLPPNEQYGHRLVIDLLAPGGVPDVRVAPPASATASGRAVVIAIDAGHGGEDPGAIGRRGVREKDVALAIARRLEQELKREPGFEPVMVRTGDYYVSHRRRIQIAHAAQANLFVSIHADAYRDASARGATVYALSLTGASDEAARRLAERENAADLMGGASLADKDDTLARVLLDLSQHWALSSSIAAGERIIRHMSGVTHMRRMQVQQAGFMVLKSPDIPSILVETGYISNPTQEAALSDAQHQANVARAIHGGIVDYFYANPPHGSYVALNPQDGGAPLRHVISRGETLSGIAERYRVSLTALRRTNGLSNDSIRAGQVLLIPQS